MQGSILLAAMLPGPWTTTLAISTTATASAQDPGTVLGEQKIAWSSGGFAGTLDDRDHFGRAVTALGDVDGDGVGDLAVGAFEDDDGGTNRGAVWILFLNADGTVRGESKIGSGSGGFLGALDNSDHFGVSLATLGDLDGDGAPELAVGAESDDDGASNSGALWLLHLDEAGMVKSEEKISQSSGGFLGTLRAGDRFGRSVTWLTDIDGDGVRDLAVGADQDDDGGTNRGAVWILFLNPDGTVRDQAKISSTAGAFAGTLDNDDRFGTSLASLGDLDGDGVGDLAVGADQDDDGGSASGAVWILFLNGDGSVKAHSKLGSSSGIALGAFDRFGGGLSAVGDLDGDGAPDLAVGAIGDDDGDLNRGATWILFLDAAGGAKSWSKISSTDGSFNGSLARNDAFGISLGGLMDLDGDGKLDLAVGADGDDEGGADRGAVWILFLEGVVTATNEPPSVFCTGGGIYELGVDTIALGGVVSDPDGDSLSFRWLEGTDLVGSGVVQAPPRGAPVDLPDTKLTSVELGEHFYQLQVADGTHAPVPCEVRVEVIDTLAPSITATSDVTSLWPPNHRLVEVTIGTEVEDASGGPIVLAASVEIDGEVPGDSGPGRDDPDYTEPVIDPVTGDIKLMLRAELSPKGKIRTYLIDITATDSSGNVGTTMLSITVEPDRSRSWRGRSRHDRSRHDRSWRDRSWRGRRR